MTRRTKRLWTVEETYDDAPEVLDLAARYGFKVDRIAMKTTHHATIKEVVLTKPATAVQIPKQDAA